MPRRRVRKGRTLAFGGGGVCSVVEEHERAHSLGGKDGVGKTLFADVIFNARPFFLFKNIKIDTWVGTNTFFSFVSLGEYSLSMFLAFFLILFHFLI